MSRMIRFKILDVKTRNILARFFFVDDFKVTVQLEDGRVVKLNCWAGNDLNPEWLIWDVERKLKKVLYGKSRVQWFCDKLRGYEGYVEIKKG